LFGLTIENTQNTEVFCQEICSPFSRVPRVVQHPNSCVVKRKLLSIFIEIGHYYYPFSNFNIKTKTMHTKLMILFLALTTSLAAQQQPLPLITTTGTAIVYVEPDEVLLDITILIKDKEIEPAREKNKQLAKQVIKYLSSQGIAREHIQTQYANFGPVYRDFKSTEVLYYEATQTIHVCIKNLDQLDQIVDDLLKMEVHRISRPQFRTTKLADFRNEARLKAVMLAKEKAQAMAGVLDQKIGKAYQIMEEQFASPMANLAYAEAAPVPNADGTSNSFAPGQLEVKATVKVSFYLD
jgi:uncharacterized protein YggE